MGPITARKATTQEGGLNKNSNVTLLYVKYDLNYLHKV